MAKIKIWHNIIVPCLRFGLLGPHSVLSTAFDCIAVNKKDSLHTTAAHNLSHARGAQTVLQLLE